MMSAFALRDYDTFEKGAKALGDLTVVAGMKGTTNYVATQILKRLTLLGINTIGDNRAPVVVTVSMGEAGLNAIRENLTDKDIPTWVAVHLYSMATKAGELKEEGPLVAAAQHLWDLGILSTEYGDSKLMSRIAGYLEGIENTETVSNQQKWDTLVGERSGAGWRSGELPEGPVVASSPFGGLSLHLLPAL